MDGLRPIVARVSGAPTNFTGSITRSSQSSATGRLLNRPGLCDSLYVQWPEAVSLCPSSAFAESLL